MIRAAATRSLASAIVVAALAGVVGLSPADARINTVAQVSAIPAVHGGGPRSTGVAAYASLLGGGQKAPRPPATSRLANLWVDANGGSCIRHRSRVRYRNAQACASFAAAYARVASGDTVGVTGKLGPQFFAGGYGAAQRAGTKTVTFRGIPGNIIQQVHSGAPNITYARLNLDAGGRKTQGAVFENGGGDHVVFRNGRIGNVVDEKAAVVDGSHVTLANVVFHDAVLRTDGVHMECLYAIVVPNLTIRNSRFSNCAIMDVLFTYGDWWNPLPPPYGNVTLEGNHFETPRDTNSSCCMYYGLYVGNTASPAPGVISGWRVRHNWFQSSVAGFDGRPVVGGVFCGNSGKSPGSWRKRC